MSRFKTTSLDGMEIIRPVEKHGSHDQKTHGSWAEGSAEFTIEEIDNELPNTVDVDLKGNFPTTRIRFEELDSKVSDDVKEKIYETVAELQTRFPIENASITVDENIGTNAGNVEFEAENIVGYCLIGKPKISLRTSYLSENGTKNRSQGNAMPSENETNSTRWIIAHEWGHAMDKRNDADYFKDQESMEETKTYLRRMGEMPKDTNGYSAYGLQNSYEAYAEAFAEYFVSGKDTTSLYTKDFAKRYGWGKAQNNISKATPRNVAILDTFDSKNPPQVISFNVAKHLPGQHDQKEHGSWATGGGGGYLSESTAKEIEESTALFQELMGPDADIKEILIGNSWASESQWEELRDKLINRYHQSGLGKNTAILQARIDMGRVGYAMENQNTKAHYEETIKRSREAQAAKADEYAEGYGQEADEMERGLAFAQERVLGVMKNGNVTIAATEEVLGAVLADGRYKNQFETRTSGGKLDVGIRKVGEGLATGTPAGTKLAERPVYGFLTDNETVHTYQSKRETVNATGGEWDEKHTLDRKLDWETITSINNYNVEQYGEIRFTLKPEVRSRSTVTIGDSLRTGVMADGLTNPKPDLINMGLYKAGAVVHMAGNPTASYVEAQIHGGVKVSDISHIYAPADRVDAVKAMVEAKGLNIPVSARAGS